MRLAEVIPITRNIFKDETLSYFTAKEVEVGALVFVPFRKKNIPALVVKTSDVEKNKTILRRLAYPLKKIKSVITPRLIAEDFFDVLKKLSQYYAAPEGLIMKNILPRRILQKAFIPGASFEKTNFRYSKLFCQGEWLDRSAYYKSVIREEFAHGASVLFCLPTASDAKAVFEEMRRGIEDYTLLISGNLKAKEFDGAWNKAISENHPLLIVGTGLILSLPRTDIGTIIVEREGSPHYKSKTRPFLDIRKAAEFLHEEFKNRIILGGDTLRVETYFRKESGEFEEPLLSGGKIQSSAECAVVSIEKKEETFISEELKNLIQKANLSGEKIFLFINRRGHNPSTICQDCGRTILCPRCEAPLVFHLNSENNSRSMVCHHCLFVSPPSINCPYCRGWRLKLFGIGIQKAVEEIKKIFPKIAVLRFDSDSVKTKNQGNALIQKFLSPENPILIGTELVFPYLMSPIDHVGIISVDALFTIPDFRINERIFSFFLYFRSLAAKTFLIQTRVPKQKIFKDVMKGDVSAFYREEIETRRNLGYPPFSKFIKLGREATSEDVVKNDILALKEKIKSCYSLDYPSFIGKVKNKYRWNLLLKVNSREWPEKYQALVSLLRDLGLQWRVEIDPESLL